MALDAKIWAPKYWFVLNTIALSYPLNPNSITKKKYYDLISNIPLFIPDNDMSNIISKFLDTYPVSPYLDSRESFIKWVHYIHNKINNYLGKPTLSFQKAMEKYYNNYKPKKIKCKEEIKVREKIIFLIIILCLITIIIILSNK